MFQAKSYDVVDDGSGNSVRNGAKKKQTISTSDNVIQALFVDFLIDTYNRQTCLLVTSVNRYENIIIREKKETSSYNFLLMTIWVDN